MARSLLVNLMGGKGSFAFRHCDLLADERVTIVSRRRNAFINVELN
jgi:hypothetical protein